MRAKVKKNITLTIAIIIVTSALVINILISKPNTTQNYSALKNIQTIYFSENDIPPENLISFKEYINGVDSNSFSDALNLPNPIYKFYGICGLIRLQNKNVTTQLANLLTNETNVTYMINGQSQKATLADATILLISSMPNWLVGQVSQDFYQNIGSALSVAFMSDYAKNNETFKNQISVLISEKNPDLLKDIYTQLNLEEPYSTKTFDEKIALIRELGTCDSIKRKNALNNLLQETNGTLLNGSINAINENDDETIADLLCSVMTNNALGENIQINAMQKYALIKKENCIDEIQRCMREKAGNKTNLLLCGIDKLNLYGTKSNCYDFLKIYLAGNFDDKVNEAAIKAITKTSYTSDKEDQQNVLGTMNFVLTKSSVSAAIYVIQWVLDSEKFLLFKPTMDRFRRYENDEIKMLAIKYIRFQKAKSGIDIITQLSTDPNPKISSAATELLQDKTVFPQ